MFNLADAINVTDLSQRYQDDIKKPGPYMKKIPILVSQECRANKVRWQSFPYYWTRSAFVKEAKPVMQ